MHCRTLPQRTFLAAAQAAPIRLRRAAWYAPVRPKVMAQAAATHELWPNQPPLGRVSDDGDTAQQQQQQQQPTASAVPEAEAESTAQDKSSTRSNDRAHLPTSLYASFPKLPPDGSTLTPEDAKCDPDKERCRTAIHVWEARCSACSGTGVARSYSSGRQQRRSMCVCLLCHGLGYVRHSTSRHDIVPHVNGTGPNTTIGRSTPAVPEKRSFDWPGSSSRGPGRRRPHGKP